MLQKTDKIAMIMFAAAQGIIYIFITMLQFTNFPLFAVMLVLMHGGIVLLIISRKKFKKGGRQVKSHYNMVYVSLALYLPVLVYKLLSHPLGYDVNDTLKLWYTVGITTAALIACIINITLLARKLQNAEKQI